MVSRRSTGAHSLALKYISSWPHKLRRIGVKLTKFRKSSTLNGTHRYRIASWWHIEYFPTLKEVLDGTVDLYHHKSVTSSTLLTQFLAQSPQRKFLIQVPGLSCPHTACPSQHFPHKKNLQNIPSNCELKAVGSSRGTAELAPE